MKWFLPMDWLHCSGNIDKLHYVQLNKWRNLCSVLLLSSEGELVIDSIFLYYTPFHWWLTILQANLLHIFKLTHVFGGVGSPNMTGILHSRWGLTSEKHSCQSKYSRVTELVEFLVQNLANSLYIQCKATRTGPCLGGSPKFNTCTCQPVQELNYIYYYYIQLQRQFW